MKEEIVEVPKWFLESVENTLRIQNNINLDKKTGETCQDRNVKESLNGLRKLLSCEELTGMERLKKLHPELPQEQPQGLDEAPKKDYRKLYEDIVNSDWYKKAYVGKSLGDFIPVEGLDGQPKRKLRKVCNLREDLKADKPLEERVEELRQIRAEKDRLDEAADAYSENILANGEDMFDAIADGFIAGAEWMAGQGWYEKAVIKGSDDVVWINYNVELPIDLAKYFKAGDKVVVQIRKVEKEK